MNFTFKSAPCGNGILLEEYVGTKKTASRWLSAEESESLRQALNNSMTETNAENATPNFKVGDWLVSDGENLYQLIDISDGRYKLVDMHMKVFDVPFSFDSSLRKWTIADAKDGDILSAKIDGDGYILIFKQIKDGWIETYGHYYITIDKFCAPTQMFCRNYQGRLYPATQEQYRTLFKKMNDDGYEWDFDKKELKKIQSHYDIANFYVGMPVLVRDRNENEWCHSWYSHYNKSGICHFNAVGLYWRQCIPFNDDTKHLLGTTDMPSEEYINW